MNNETFWELYNSGKISCKIYEGDVDGSHKTIEAFQYDSKFYLRIIYESHWVTGTRKFGKRYRMSSLNCYFKEFNNKNSANNYFKKASVGLLKVK